MNKFLKSKTAYFILPLILLIAAVIVKMNLSYIKLILPSCAFKDLTGLDCPACGNTRSITALLNGDITASLKYNITPFLAAVIFILWYIEYGLNLFGKNIRILPGNMKFWIAAAILFLIYCLLRNLVYL